MATYAMPSDTLHSHLPDDSEPRPLDMIFDDLITSGSFDPALVDYFDPNLHALPQDMSHFLPSSDSFIPSNGPSKIAFQSYPSLPSTLYGSQSSGTTSPSLGSITDGGPQYRMADADASDGIFPSLETAFQYHQSELDLGGYDLLLGEKQGFSVDPSLIQQLPSRRSGEPNPYFGEHLTRSQVPSLSPSGSNESIWSGPAPTIHTVPGPMASATSRSPSSGSQSRKQSINSLHFRESNSQLSLSSLDDDGKERTACPYPECGKIFKDLKAHMLTHQNERPEKCPISSCEFHKRGFARKYDRNRHLVTTHYKATVVCGFCPGEGSPSEVTFNRVDIFKRHLVTSHGVDQNASSSKKRPSRGLLKSPTSNEGVSGKCTTCGNNFHNAQELFDHLDDCVLRVVTQTDPSESANERNLRSVIEDCNVQATLKLHSLPNYDANSTNNNFEDDDDASELDLDDGGRTKMRKSNIGDALSVVDDSHVIRAGDQNAGRRTQPGLTYSKGGVDLAVGKGRRRRKHYPQSWGCSMNDMTLKKRVMCFFDGQRRLAKDDMMLSNEFQRRVDLPNGGWVTDLDIETVKRAEAFHNMPEEDKGPWRPTNYPDASLGGEGA